MKKIALHCSFLIYSFWKRRGMTSWKEKWSDFAASYLFTYSVTIKLSGIYLDELPVKSKQQTANHKTASSCKLGMVIITENVRK